MRTEVKIGIIVGLMVVGAAVFFFVQQGHRAGSDVTDVLPMDAPARRVTGGDDTTRQARPGLADRTTGSERRSAADTSRRPRGVETPRRPTPSLGQPGARPGGSGATGPQSSTPTPARPATIVEEPTSQPSLGGERPEIGAPTAEHRPPVIGAETSTETARDGAPATPVNGGGARRTPVVTPPPRPTIGADTTRRPVRTSLGGRARRPGKHIIAEDDNLWSLAMHYYDDGSLWPTIKAANPGLDENKLPIGQEIIIPPRDEVAAPVARTAERPAPPPGRRPEARPHTYVIEQGDTLIGIARNILGDGNRWREIWELNQQAIPNPDVLPIGTELKLPPRNSSGPEHG